jgi:hypothetical protein
MIKLYFYLKRIPMQFRHKRKMKKIKETHRIELRAANRKVGEELRKELSIYTARNLTPPEEFYKSAVLYIETERKTRSPESWLKVGAA